jgi:hypothetical protein
MLGAIWRLTTTIVLVSFVTSIFGAAESNGKFGFQVIIPDKSYFPSYTLPSGVFQAGFHCQLNPRGSWGSRVT